MHVLTGGDEGVFLAGTMAFRAVIDMTQACVMVLNKLSIGDGISRDGQDAHIAFVGCHNQVRCSESVVHLLQQELISIAVEGP